MMAPDFDFSTAQWIRGANPIIDPNAPTDVPYTPYDREGLDRPLIEAIGAISRRLPDHVAIDDGVIRVTYSQLYAMACRLSHAIARAALPAGPIGILLPNDAMYPVAMLGSLAAGRPCLLLSQDSPADFNRRLIELSGSQALVVNASDARNRSSDVGPRLIPIELALMAGADSDSGPAARLGPDEPAFLVSTSGSTGVPKLLARSQRDAQLRASKTINLAHYGENDRILTLGAPAAGSAVGRRFGPLLAGATLHIVDVPRAGMAGILRVLREDRITVVRATSSLLKALSQLDGARENLASLRLMWGGGEGLLQKDYARIRKLLPPGCLFGHGLNMTETTITSWFVPENDDHDPVRVAAGYVVPDAEILILGEDGRACPAGEIGELVVRSKTVALGEWAGGRLIPNRFQDDPTDPLKRIYRTGDMVRMCPDGVMVVHGRKDRMIKIRGQRVEPALVEASIRDVPGVADAVVATRQSDGDTRIYGFVVPDRQAADGLLTTIHDALKGTLPSYMRPSEIRIVDALPSNAGGKVDVMALLATIRDENAAAQASSAAKAGTSPPAVSEKAKRMVADAWKFAFGGQIKSTALSFDAAGGDSLKFMQIVFRLEQLGKTAIPLSAFDIAMTQDDMARALDGLMAGAFEPERAGKLVFLLPGVGGDEPRLLQFRVGCAPELSVISLDYGDWPQWVIPGASFATVLDGVVARIEELAPAGPLFLAGYSLGGQAALAIAAKLHAAGREIERLLILDSDSIIPSRAPGVTDDAPVPPLTLREELSEWRAARRRGEGAFVLGRMAMRRLLSPRWAPLLRWLARHRRAVLRGRADFFLSFYLRRSLMLEMAAGWRRKLGDLPRLPIPITLFLVNRSGETVSRDAGWRAYSTDVSVVPVGGDHFTMLDPPHLADLCARFRAACGAATVEERRAS